MVVQRGIHISVLSSAAFHKGELWSGHQPQSYSVSLWTVVSTTCRPTVCVYGIVGEQTSSPSTLSSQELLGWLGTFKANLCLPRDSLADCCLNRFLCCSVSLGKIRWGRLWYVAVLGWHLLSPKKSKTLFSILQKCLFTVEDKVSTHSSWLYQTNEGGGIPNFQNHDLIFLIKLTIRM